MDLRIEELEADDLDRIREIDRSESVRFLYIVERGALRRVESDLEIPTWDNATIAKAKARLAPKLAAGGVLLGALLGDRLVGVAVLGGELFGPDSNRLELAFLYVSSSHRRRGVAKDLMEKVCRRARQSGAEQLYIASSDTHSAVDFYLGYGCVLAERVDSRIFEENVPTDIHLTFDLN
jgi:ribosomal protein S18 acetylase RimI-like enzyme